MCTDILFKVSFKIAIVFSKLSQRSMEWRKQIIHFLKHCTFIFLSSSFEEKVKKNVFNPFVAPSFSNFAASKG